MRDGQGFAKGGGAALQDGAKGASTVVASAAATDSIFSPAMLRRTSLLLLVLQNYSQFMLMRESRKDPEDGSKRAPFSAAAAVVVQEVIKTVVSLAIIAKAHGFALESTLQHLHEHLVVRWRDLVKLSVPGILYTAQNNLIYIATQYLDAPTCQVLYQLKIITTALCSVAVLHRALSRQQWVSLLVLFFGASMVQISSLRLERAADAASSSSSSSSASSLTSTALLDGSEAGDTDAGWIPDEWKGGVAILTAVFLSGFAGVYFEKVLKQSDTDLWTRNVQLGIFGILFGFLGLVFSSKDMAIVQSNGLLAGFDLLVWIVVLDVSAGGLLVAVVVKYADNIAKGFATSVSIILSALTTTILLGQTMTLLFVVGTSLVLGATFLFSNSDAPKPASAAHPPSSAGGSLILAHQSASGGGVGSVGAGGGAGGGGDGGGGAGGVEGTPHGSVPRPSGDLEGGLMLNGSDSLGAGSRAGLALRGERGGLLSGGSGGEHGNDGLGDGVDEGGMDGDRSRLLGLKPVGSQSLLSHLVDGNATPMSPAALMSPTILVPTGVGHAHPGASDSEPRAYARTVRKGGV